MNITVYSKPNCVQCDMTKSYLKSKGQEFQEIHLDVGQPKVTGAIYEDLVSFKAANPDARSVPQVFIDGVRIGGFTELKQQLESIMNNKKLSY